MCPENTGLSNLEVSAGDSDFINVIAPAAVSAISISEGQSPIANCKFVSSKTLSYLPADHFALLKLSWSLHTISALLLD